jgi:hypothetical protein
MRWFAAGAMLLSLAAFGAGQAAAAPIVSFTVSGSAGDWTLDFSVTNNLGVATQRIYFFGVELDARDIVASPPGWDPDAWPSWNNLFYGGSATVYNNNWIDFSLSGGTTITDGETQSGFKAHTTAIDAPTAVKWFCYAYSTSGEGYYGGDHFNTPLNPGFEGVARSGVVPEPSTFVLAGLGVMGLVGYRLRRRARS